MALNGSDQDPWKKPGDRGGSREDQSQPQNSGNNDQSPPDLEEIFNNLLKKLGAGSSNSGGSSNKGTSLKFTKLLPLGIIIAAIVWAISGFYTIKEAERGVVMRFGQLHSIVQPGLNWKPTFIDYVVPVNVEQVKELRTQGAMLTQDENMVKVEMTVQYRIHDPAKYLFSVTNADDSLNQATDSALRYVIGHMSMDDILTTGRSVVRERTWKSLNEIIKVYDMGLDVLDVNFQSARPPEDVKAAFDDAIKAQEDEQRYIREAEAYAREREPIARGEAQRIIEQATAYKEQVVLDAKGEIERFQQLLPEFKAAPQLLRERLYIQTMEKIMSNTPKVMLDGANGNNLTVLPLEQLLSKTKNNSQNTQPIESKSSSYIPLNTESYRQVPATTNSTTNEYRESVRQGRFN